MKGIGGLAALVCCCSALLSPAVARADRKDADFDWQAFRFGSASVNRLSVIPGSLRPDQAVSGAAELRLTVVGDACGAGGAYAWRIDDAAVTPTRLGACEFSLPVAAGTHKVSLNAQLGDTTYSATREVHLDDLLIVSIGDSVASAEGNPDVPAAFGRNAIWLQPNCHRSLFSAPAQAALALERGEQGSSVSFVPLACSGAQITSGLLRPYRGIEPAPGGALQPSQVGVVNKIERRPGFDIDALLISIGANDLGFSHIVEFCLLTVDCTRRHFDPGHPHAAADASFPTLADYVKARIAGLPRLYRRLDDRISRRIPRSRIFITEYFDPTHAAGGYCDIPFGADGVDPAEARWAHDNVLAPLNQAVSTAAAANHWQLVGGVAAAFYQHGICAPPAERWVRTLAESFFLHSEVGPARLTGLLHPNRVGQLETARLLYPKLAALLGVSAPFEEQDGDEPGFFDGPGPALLAGGIGLVVGAALGLFAARLLRRRKAARTS
jgi:GDSL-like Lipase/Acylhydrolase family